MHHTPGDLQDSDIIHRVIGGEVNVFEILLDRYRPKVFSIVGKLVPPEGIDDVAHEVFIRAYVSLPTFSDNSPFGHWLSKIAVRCCYDFWRDRRRRQEIPLSTITDEHQRWLDDVLAGRSQEDFDREANRREAGEVLRYALERLKPEDRTVLVLVYLDGLSVKETANLLGWSMIKVKIRAHRSKKRLRKIIARLLGKEVD